MPQVSYFDVLVRPADMVKGTSSEKGSWVLEAKSPNAVVELSKIRDQFELGTLTADRPQSEPDRPPFYLVGDRKLDKVLEAIDERSMNVDPETAETAVRMNRHTGTIDGYAEIETDVHPPPIIGRGTTVDAMAEIQEGAIIGENCYIARGAKIEARCEIGDGCTVGVNASLGADTVMEANSRLEHDAKVDAYRTGTISKVSGPAPLIRAGSTIEAGAVVIGAIEIDGRIGRDCECIGKQRRDEPRSRAGSRTDHPVEHLERIVTVSGGHGDNGPATPKITEYGFRPTHDPGSSPGTDEVSPQRQNIAEEASLYARHGRETDGGPEQEKPAPETSRSGNDPYTAQQHVVRSPDAEPGGAAATQAAHEHSDRDDR